MRSPVAWLKGVRHPEAFHGHGVPRGFFEGWYIKLVSEDRRQRWAVIPGVFRGEAEGGALDEAFVQVLDGQTGRSWYHRFEPDQFRASSTAFQVEVGPNRFGPGGVELDLPQLRGRLRYTSELQPWPVTLREPGIMGWYGLVPFMQCFHGIVSFGHGLSGTLEVEGAPQSFDGGRGYIEKDWGKSFPSSYVWMASNHIDAEIGDGTDASFIGSVAVIPWLGGAFRGSILGLRHGGRLHKWTTYNGSEELRLTIDDSHVGWTVTGPDGTLELDAERVRGGLLHAPRHASMHERVEETLDADIRLRHTDVSGKVLLDGIADCAGMEVFGDTARMLAL
ncbi:tocopherol cyclase family protein [Microbacterium sediminicola]|uniref:Tocopherol cyclase family protein n=1 Tax=Microbacterium sediminicola TaxID=415210 RepID=A0ABN2ID19_9MICO